MIKTPLSTVIGGAFWTPGATILGSSSQTLTQLIKSLFANNEQGFFYDPNDLTTMFQDAAGTVPVTGVGQPVGLMLDKSGALKLGEEKIPLPLNFNGWTKTAAVTATTNNSFTTSGAGGCTLPIFGSNNTRTYQIRIKGNSTVGGNIRSGGAGSVGIAIPIGNFDIIATNPAIASFSPSLYLALNTAGTLTIDSISVKEVIGNHTYQTTSAARPILQDAPRRIDFDTVDDKLITTLPAQLTGCTVIRSVPGVGTQILTGQTIPATYEDNKDHCGLIVINRALTATETSQITKLFNRAAGV